MNMANVIELLTPTNRVRAYIGYAIVSGLIGAALAGFAAISTVAPVALIFASAFVNSLGIAFGLLAASNVGATEPTQE